MTVSEQNDYPLDHVHRWRDWCVLAGLSTTTGWREVKAGRGPVITKLTAPKPVLMSFIIEGIMTQKLPWGLVLVGVFISIVLELSGISALAFAVGVYLPVSTSTPIMVGGLVRWLIDRRQKTKTSDAEADSGPGVLFSSGRLSDLAWNGCEFVH